MSWFRRKQNSDYLQTTQTVSKPMGIILTILTVLVICAVIFSLFLGGRWLYRHLDGTNVPKEEAVVADVVAKTPEESNNTAGSTSGESGSGSGTSTNNSNTSNSGASTSSGSSNSTNGSTTAGSNTPSNSSSATGANTSTNASGSTSTTSSNAGSGSGNIAATGPSSNTAETNQTPAGIPETGPTDLLAIFVVAVVLGIGIHNLALRRNL